MKIDPSEPRKAGETAFSPIKDEKVRRAGKKQKKISEPISSPLKGEDILEIIQEEVNDAPEVDETRIAQFKEKIRRGEFPPADEEIADALLRHFRGNGKMDL